MECQDETDQPNHCLAKTGVQSRLIFFMESNQISFQGVIFLTDKTLFGFKAEFYVILKILKYMTGSSAKSYEIKFAMSVVIGDNDISEERVGVAINEVLNHVMLRGKSI